MNQHDITIRQEKKEDHRAVEELVREAFWNVYRPGCFEHYVIHVLRDDPAFVKELDLVMEQDGRLIGQNMFMETVIRADDGRDIPVLTMGPIGILPEKKRRGYGKMLLDESLRRAAALGCSSRATSPSTERAVLTTPAISASAITIFRKARMIPSFSAGSLSAVIFTGSPVSTGRLRATTWTPGTWTGSTGTFRPGRNRGCRGRSSEMRW